MTQDEMWKAVVENDENYDGTFFYGVKTTGIYCRPSCKSKTPKRDNVCFFKTGENALNEGFRACKRCRSDLMDFQPMKEIAVKTKTLIDQMFKEKSALNQQMSNIGLTQRRMVEIFKDEYGISVAEYVNDLRLMEAEKLLKETDEPVIDVAYAVGFNSLSAFYRFFKNSTKVTPAAYRKKNKKL